MARRAPGTIRNWPAPRSVLREFPKKRKGCGAHPEQSGNGPAALRFARVPKRERWQKTMSVTNSHSDAFVFFGATGDLAYKKIFPALQAMLKRGHLNVPVIGVAKAGWTLDQFRARAR
jgi:hypothetical protein